MTNCVRLSETDNVVTVIAAIAEGGPISIEGNLNLAAREAIPVYHKASIADIAKGSAVRKYGQVIGLASETIPAGTHVHSHNLVSETDYAEAIR